MWWFEVVHLIFKVLYAGVLIFIGRGTNSQLTFSVVSLILCVAVAAGVAVAHTGTIA